MAVTGIGRVSSPIGQRYRSGYKVRSQFAQFIAEKLMALTLLLILSPLFIILPILIKLQDGGPVFFLSRRMGKDQKVFNMIKFRTLVQGAEQKTGGQVLTRHHRLELPVGKFLRDTRLDEIPQLFNVIKGDMTFFGPRPERPAVYEEQCKLIPGYGKRFEVKPGLLGFSQLYTPHGTPKRLRAMVDNIYVRRSHDFLFEVIIVFYSMWRLGVYTLVRGSMLLSHSLIMMGSTGKMMEKRALERVCPKGMSVTLYGDDSFDEESAITTKFGDINDDFALVFTEGPLDTDKLNARLKITVPRRFGRDRKRRQIRCAGEIFRSRQVNENSDTYAHVIKLRPISPLNGYLMDKYVLGKSVF